MPLTKLVNAHNTTYTGKWKGIHNVINNTWKKSNTELASEAFFLA
jgi:hypothetical protein